MNEQNYSNQSLNENVIINPTEKSFKKSHSLFWLLTAPFALIGAFLNFTTLSALDPFVHDTALIWGFLIMLWVVWSIFIFFSSYKEKYGVLRGCLPVAIILGYVAVLFPLISGNMYSTIYASKVAAVIFLISTLLSIYFAYKNSKKLGLIVVVTTLLIGGGFGTYIYTHSSPSDTFSIDNGNILVGPGGVVGPNTPETKALFDAITDIKNATSTETCKKYEGTGSDLTCVINLALKNKNPQLCNFFTESRKDKVPSLKNYCLAYYIDRYKDTSACSYMSLEEKDDYSRAEACPSLPGQSSAAEVAGVDPLITLEVNGSTDVSKIVKDSNILVTWKTTKRFNWTECDTFGIAYKKADGTGMWGDANNHILAPNGTMTLIADYTPVSIGMDCYNDKAKSTGDRAYVGPLLQ